MSLNDIRRWFQLNHAERWWLGGILAIFLIGLIARQLHGRPETVDANPPAAQRQ